jgi:taurine dioxygenase
MAALRHDAVLKNGAARARLETKPCRSDSRNQRAALVACLLLARFWVTFKKINEGFVMIITPQSPSGCGALVTDIDLKQSLSVDLISELRAVWVQHQVLGFPDQFLALEDLERFAEAFGEFGDDPFFDSIAGHPHIAEVRRDALETTPLFAESWHSDWSFLAKPPTATLLHGQVIPPQGGDTLFADQYAAWDALPEDLKALISGRNGIHSARNGYARDGLYGEQDVGRSMAIRYSDEALKTQVHPMVKAHPESGRMALFVNPGYTIGIEGLAEAEARALLMQLFAHQTQDAFIYRHQWSAGMLTLWDNRCVLHAATGGYEGFDRLLHRITIAG